MILSYGSPRTVKHFRIFVGRLAQINIQVSFSMRTSQRSRDSKDESRGRPISFFQDGSCLCTVTAGDFSPSHITRCSVHKPRFLPYRWSSIAGTRHQPFQCSASPFCCIYDGRYVSQGRNTGILCHEYDTQMLQQHYLLTFPVSSDG